MSITAEDFIRAWQTSANVTEVSARLGMSYKAATVRAAGLRKKGVPLKRFTSHGGIQNDYEALTKLAESLAPKGE